MKQRETIVLLGLLIKKIVISLGDMSVFLSLNDFWTEPIIEWMAIVLPTGKTSLNTCHEQLSSFKKLVSFKDRTWFSVSEDEPQNFITDTLSHTRYDHVLLLTHYPKL